MRRGVLLAVVLALAPGAVARAQGYTPSPPTKGALYHDGQDSRYLLGGEWLYRADLSDVGVAQGWWRENPDATGWSFVTLPNAYNAGDFSNASMNGWVGWYRRDFTLPAGAFASYVPASARRWIVRFESINYRATVWLNGHLLGNHVGAFLPFEFDLSGLRAGVNRLIVRVDNRRGPTDLPPGPGGGWWNYGGILREVYVRAVERADLKQVVVRPLLPCASCAATIVERAQVRNPTAQPQRVSLTGVYGRVPLSFGSATIPPHATWSAKASAVLPHPRLWSPDHPSLYRATLTLADAGGRRIGGYTTYSGVRSIVVTPGGRMKLNGRLLNLRGVDMHEQDLITGGALDVAQQRQRIGWIRSLGATLIRAHYPLPPEMEEMADRDGILLWSEVPVYQVNSQYLGLPSWLKHAHALLAANIATNQNHPAVLLWSVGNELSTPAPRQEAAYIASAAALAHRLDPTRPVGMATSDWPGVACQRAYRPLDVIGFNDYFGYFDAGGGSTDDRDELGPFLDSWRACYPTKALFISEFGFDANRTGPVEERGTYAFQSNSAAYHLDVFATKHWLSGAIYWIIQDFARSPGSGGGNPWPDPPFIQKGLVDLQDNFKPAFGVVSAIFHSTLQIAPARRPPSAPHHGPAPS